jgi:hypothetical protein
MRLLQIGITGFDATGEVPVRDFKRAVHAAAMSQHARVGTVTPANGVTPNFHRIDVELGSQKLVVLCNRHIPVVAFASGIDEMEIGQFVQASPDFAAALTECGFVMGDAAELRRPVTSADLEALSAAEQRQAKYWKPRRVGDVIFNWWD